MKRIGIILNHIKLRSDIRLFINELSQDNNIVLFGNKEEFNLINCSSCELRELVSNRNYLSRLYNRLLKELYHFFGNVPKTIHAYDDYQKRIIHKKGSRWQINKRLFRHQLKMIMPHILSYDNYLKLLIPSKDNISDIDNFIAFTDLNHPELISKVKKHNIMLFIYIHSWDHIPKFTKFPKKNINYITWNESIKYDLTNIHGVNKSNIKTIGASQFYFIKDYLDNNRIHDVNQQHEYIYFPCSFGYPIVAKQEVKIIKLVAKELLKIDKTIKLVVRIYPMLHDQFIYKSLETIENIIFDGYSNNKKGQLDRKDHEYKLNMIENALAVLHVGTTIGLEASYTNTPVLYLNLEDVDYKVSTKSKNHIFYSWNQYHLKKYYDSDNYISVIKSKIELNTALRIVLNKERVSELMAYNYFLRKNSHLFNVKNFTKKFLEIIDHV